MDPQHPRAEARARTRREVGRAALPLFLARGFDAVTVDEIAEAAGISRRTFFRYFDTKEDVLLLEEAERFVDLRAALSSRPVGEPLLRTVRAAVLAAAGEVDGDHAEVLDRLRLVASSPSVRARSLERQTAWEVAIRDVIAEHLGEEPATSLVGHVVGAATVAALRAAASVWLACDGARPVADVVAEAFDLLAGGLVLDEG